MLANSIRFVICEVYAQNRIRTCSCILNTEKTNVKPKSITGTSAPITDNQEVQREVQYHVSILLLWTGNKLTALPVFNTSIKSSLSRVLNKTTFAPSLPSFYFGTTTPL